MNKDKLIEERPKKKVIKENTCLDKNFNDCTPIVPEVPHRKPEITSEYEKRLHHEKIERPPITRIPQKDNVFNFEPEKEKNHKKRFEGQVPSQYYVKYSNREMLSNQSGDYKPLSTYNQQGRKDNLNNIFGSNENDIKERPHKKVDPEKNNTKHIFDFGKNNIPVGYKEISSSPGKGDFKQLSSSAKNNIENVRKNGRKPLKKDF